MYKNMEHGSRVTHHSSDTDTHINISDLGCGRIGDHAVDTALSYRGDRAENHAEDSENEQNLADRKIFKYLDSDTPIVYLEQ